jgi:hypothetical protein
MTGPSNRWPSPRAKLDLLTRWPRRLRELASYDVVSDGTSRSSVT